MNSPARFSIRKIAAIIATFVLVISGLSLGVSPASAQTYHSPNAGKDYTVVIGDTFNMSFLCTGDNGDNVTDTNYRSGTIPPGMTWNTGVLSGTATTLGDYTFGDWQCLFSNGAGGWQSVGGAYDWVTIHVIPPFTQAPSITATALNDADCNFRIIGTMPQTPDSGSATIRIANTNSNVDITLRNYAAGELVDITASAADLRTLETNPNVISTTYGGLGLANMCGTPFSVTLGYQHAGAPVATASVNGFNATAIVTVPTLLVRNTSLADCTFEVTASVPQTADAGSISLSVSDANGSYNYTLRDLSPNELITVKFNGSLMFDTSPATNADIVSSAQTGSPSSFCGYDSDVTWVANLNVSLSYQHNGGPAQVADQTVQPHLTYPAQIFVTALGDQACSVEISGTFRNQSISGSQKIEITNNLGDVAQLSLRDYAPYENFDLIFSTLDMQNLFNSNITSTNVFRVFGETHTNFCGTTMRARLIADSPWGATSEVSSRDVLVDQVGYTPQLQVSALGGADCSIRVTGVYPLLVSDTIAQLIISQSSPGTLTYATDLPYAVAGGLFSLDVPLLDRAAVEQLPGYDTTTGDAAPTCDSTEWNVVLRLNFGSGSIDATKNIIVSAAGEVIPDACVAGTWSATGNTPCAPATPGHYVGSAGARSETACDIGYFSDMSGAARCTEAPKGTYVATVGAISTTPCGAGKTTVLTGARSAYECYTLIKQTAKGLRVLPIFKAGGKFTTSKTTDLGAPLALTATGACTFTEVREVNKLSGSKVKVPRYKIAVGKKGVCTLTYTNAGTEKYAPYTLVKKIKITKTGK